MANNRSSRLQPKPSQLQRTVGRGNPTSNKISQTQNALFNQGKSFSQGGLVDISNNISRIGSSGPPPPPPPSFTKSLTINSSSATITANTVLSFTASFYYAPATSYELYFISASNQYSATPNQTNFVGGSGSIVFSGIPIESETTYLASGSVTVANIEQDPDVDFTASLQTPGLSDPVSTIGSSLLTQEFLIEYEPGAYDAFIIRVDAAGATKENLTQIQSSFIPEIKSVTL